MTEHKSDRRWQGYKNRASGELGEKLVSLALQKMGFRMVEKVATPWRVIFKNHRPIHAFPVEKVSGDFRAIEPSTGRQVLVEVKTHDADTLPWSSFQPHQIHALQENSDCKGLSLMAWVREGVVHIIYWPAAGFGPGKSMKYAPEGVVA